MLNDEGHDLPDQVEACRHGHYPEKVLPILSSGPATTANFSNRKALKLSLISDEM
jgi:hypothetical protein